MDHDSSQKAIELPSLSDSRFRWWILVLPFIMIVFLFGCYGLVNGDIWWHLKTGELILETQQIPAENLFTYTNPKSSWIDLHWGFQCFVALIYTYFGAFGLIVAKSLVGATTFLLLLLTVRNSLPAWFMLLCWAPFLSVFAGRYHVRPEMLSMLLLACTLWVLHNSARRPSLLWLLIPIQIVWVNVQGLFILQHLLVGAYLLEQLLTFLFERRNAQLLRRLLLAFILLTMASFINPYGLQGALFPLQLMGKMSGELRVFFQSLAGETNGISEYFDRSGLLAVTKDSTILMLFGTAFAVVISQIGSSLYRRKLDIYHWSLIGGFGYLAWQMNRNSNLFALVYGYLLCSNAANIVQSYRLAKSNISSQPFPKHWSSFAEITTFIILVAALSLTINDAQNHGEQTIGQSPRRIYFTEQHPWYNHNAAQFISDIPAPLNVYARHKGTGFAGVVIYHCFDKVSENGKRVYADARLEANSVEVLVDFESIPKLLERDMLAAEALLIDDQGQLPLLVLGNELLLRRPGLLQSLIDSERWQCIYISEFNVESWDRGVCMFMTATKRTSLNLPRVSVEPLMRSR
jgi:hypothetical protein